MALADVHVLYRIEQERWVVNPAQAQGQIGHSPAAA
jgi:hypothetical protein